VRERVAERHLLAGYTEGDERRHQRLIGVEQRPVEVEQWDEQGSALARREHRGSAGTTAVLARLGILVPARTALEACTRVEAERRQVEPIDLVGAAERALEMPARFTHVPPHTLRRCVCTLPDDVLTARDVIWFRAMVDYEVNGHYAVLTINRPEARNAVNGAVASGIEEGIDKLEADDDVWVGILTGVPPVFCAGADLKEINAGNAGALQTKRGGFGGIVQRDREKPIIAAVDGPALAGGTEIVLSCDLVVASRSATFGIPEVKRSLVAAAGGLFRLPRKIPMNVAMECALTGDPISAERAYHFGLVNVLVDDGEALNKAVQLADRVCANAPIAVRETRKIVRDATMAPDDVGWRMSMEAMSKAMQSEDFSEGLTAFIEKRPPAWKGR
jgi:enoyl-CoA hydratase